MVCTTTDLLKFLKVTLIFILLKCVTKLAQSKMVSSWGSWAPPTSLKIQYTAIFSSKEKHPCYWWHSQCSQEHSSHLRAQKQERGRQRSILTGPGKTSTSQGSSTMMFKLLCPHIPKIIFQIFYLFIFLTVLGLSWGMWDLIPWKWKWSHSIVSDSLWPRGL